MNCDELMAEVASSKLYTLHCHTQFCDGRDTMQAFVDAALVQGFDLLGFTPHSPIPISSPCNMLNENVASYLAEFNVLKTYAEPRGLRLLAGMEVDYLSPAWGADNPYFKALPLDYIIASVHFIPNQQGEPVDIDGSFESFSKKMNDKFHGDIRYVVDTFFNQTHQMLSRGGFQIIGHFDKITLNASLYQQGVERTTHFKRLVYDLIDHIEAASCIVEINTKHYTRHGLFFPAQRYWNTLINRNIPLIVNTDAHEPHLLAASRSFPISYLQSLL